MKLCFDIETDGLDHTKIWLLVARDMVTDEEYIFSDYESRHPNLDDFKALFDRADVICGHNIIGFDIPALTKHTGWKVTGQKLIDTMLLSQLNDYYRPSLDQFKALSKKGNHAMATWGFALGDEKHDDPGWMEYSDEMRRRCRSDVEINVKIYKYLLRETSILRENFPAYGKAIQLEHEISSEMSVQEENGWLFDEVKAQALLQHINVRMAEIELEVEPHLKPRQVYLDKEPRVAKRLKNGQWDRVTREWFKDREIESPYQRIKTVATDLGNNQAVLDLLFENGWEPTEWNWKKIDGKLIKGTPKLSEDSYESITGEIGQMVGEWRTYRSRRGIIEGMLRLQRDDKRISCSAFVIGTNTFRMRHRGIVNIPGAYAVLGKELRECFTSEDGRKIVAADSDSNQLRGMAHYLNNKEVSDAIAFGTSDDGSDIHTRNANLVGVTRPIVKNLTYALLFGAGDPKLGETAGMKGKGKELRAKMMVAYPGFEVMLYKFEEEWSQNYRDTGRGYVLGMDGRRVYCEKYKVFNALLQTFEAITCKAACAEAMKIIRAEKLDADLICFYHDEINMDVAEKDAERVGEILAYALGPFITETYNITIPMGGTAVIGNNWFEVH